MKEIEKIGSEQAQLEHNNRRRMAKEDEAKIIKKESKKHNVFYDSTTDFSPYNWILSTVDFRNMKNMAEGMRLMYEYLWGYIKTYDRNLNTLKNYIDLNTIKHPLEIQEIIDAKTPLEMCRHSLELITKAARDRSKAKKYGVKVEKKTLIKGGNAGL